MGASKGGELALLPGATYPESIRVVAGYSPGGLVWQRVPSNLRDLRPPRSSGPLGGRPVPFVGYARPSFSETVLSSAASSPPTSPSYERSLDAADQATIATASIPVEKINGPVLLISGTDGLTWPSARLSDADSWVKTLDFLEKHLKG